MLHTVGELKAGVQGLLQNITLSKVVNLNGALERAARTVVQQADVPEASGMLPITLYNGVTYYEAPDLIFASVRTDCRTIWSAVMAGRAGVIPVRVFVFSPPV